MTSCSVVLSVYKKGGGGMGGGGILVCSNTPQHDRFLQTIFNLVSVKTVFALYLYYNERNAT